MEIETNEKRQCLSFAYCHEDGCNWNPDTAEFELEYEQILVSCKWDISTKVIYTLTDPRTCSLQEITPLHCQNILLACLIVILKWAKSRRFWLTASFLLVMTCSLSPLVFWTKKVWMFNKPWYWINIGCCWSNLDSGESVLLLFQSQSTQTGQTTKRTTNERFSY